MSYIPKTISEVISEYLNRTTFLPAIQREYVWGNYGIEKLFDSIMGDFPISTFLFWKIKEENKNQWVAYEFIREYDQENPHNKEASVIGINQDIYFVLDGQQRLTSLLVGLKGSYRYFYYRWRKCRLYLNILKEPIKDENPEELTYEFQFRENGEPDIKSERPQYWYLVGDILNFDDAEDAKKSIKLKVSHLPEVQRETAYTHIGRLHSRIHTSRLLNYYEERSQDYDKVVEAFIRANTGGVKLEYSDILLSTATAKWVTLNAREEIHSFTDDINSIGSGYAFGKDFVMKGCLYLTHGLPIQYRISTFTRNNLEKIEQNWLSIKDNIEMSIRLASRFGFSDKNLVAKIALLPVAYYLAKLDKPNFVNSTHKNDVRNQIIIQKWLAIAFLKNAFSSSTDTTLTKLQEIINSQPDWIEFPYLAMNEGLGIEATFNETEIQNHLASGYSTKYSYLILSLLYQDRDWKDKNYHEDHIFPKSEFTHAKLRQRGYDETKITEYQKDFNSICNLQLLTDKENLEKRAEDFAVWLSSRDTNFRERHAIPEMASYEFDHFLEFIKQRQITLAKKLSELTV